MVNLINSITDIARFAMQNSSRKISLTSERIATSQRGPCYILDYIIGSKLRNNTTILSSVSKGINYGIQLLKNTQSVLMSVREELKNARGIIAKASSLHAEQLDNLNQLYYQSIANVQRLLSRSFYDGRNLFDGSLAGGPGNNPAQLIPATASPLSIRVGEDITNVFTIAIPRLLAGNGVTVDVAVPGIFTPVLPITAVGVNMKDNIVAALRSIFGAVPNIADVADAAAADNVIQGLCAAANSVGQAVIDAAKAAANAALPATADALGVNTVLNAAMNAALNVAAQFIAPEAIAAIRTILNTVPAAGLANATTSANYHEAIQNLLQQGNDIGDAIIRDAKAVSIGDAAIAVAAGGTIGDEGIGDAAILVAKSSKAIALMLLLLLLLIL